MKHGKALSLLCSAGLLILIMAGCGSADSSDLSNSEIVGQVQSIDGNTITLLIGTLSETEQTDAPVMPTDGTDTVQPQSGDQTQDDNAQAQDAPEGTPTGNSDDDSGEAPSGSDAPSGDGSGEAPSGGAQPSGSMQTFTAGTQTVTIELTDDTVITVESFSGETEGTVDDITVDAVLDVTIGDDNTVTSVTVKNLIGGGGGNFGDGTAPTDDGTSTGGDTSTDDGTSTDSDTSTDGTSSDDVS